MMFSWMNKGTITPGSEDIEEMMCYLEDFTLYETEIVKTWYKQTCRAHGLEEELYEISSIAQKARGFELGFMSISAWREGLVEEDDEDNWDEVPVLVDQSDYISEGEEEEEESPIFTTMLTVD